MIKRSAFFILTFLMSFQIKAQEVAIPKSEGELFRPGNLVAATAILTSTPYQFLYPSQDMKACRFTKRSTEKLRQRVGTFIERELPQALAQLDAHWENQLSQWNIQFVFSEFGELRSQHRMYTYFNTKESAAVIWIDCHEIKAHRGVESAIAHELTHVLLARENHEPWFVEAIAQMIEESAGGTMPALTSVKALESSPTLPAIFSGHPLTSNAEYGLAFLWAKSVAAEFKSFSPLKYMAFPSSEFCEAEVNYTNRLLCRAREKMADDEHLKDRAADLTAANMEQVFKQVLLTPSSQSILHDPWLWRGREDWLRRLP